MNVMISTNDSEMISSPLSLSFSRIYMQLLTDWENFAKTNAPLVSLERQDLFPSLTGTTFLCDPHPFTPGYRARQLRQYFKLVHEFSIHFVHVNDLFLNINVKLNTIFLHKSTEVYLGREYSAGTSVVRLTFQKNSPLVLTHEPISLDQRHLKL